MGHIFFLPRPHFFHTCRGVFAASLCLAFLLRLGWGGCQPGSHMQKWELEVEASFEVRLMGVKLRIDLASSHHSSTGFGVCSLQTNTCWHHTAHFLGSLSSLQPRVSYSPGDCSCFAFSRSYREEQRTLSCEVCLCVCVLSCEVCVCMCVCVVCSYTSIYIGLQCLVSSSITFYSSLLLWLDWLVSEHQGLCPLDISLTLLLPFI